MSVATKRDLFSSMRKTKYGRGGFYFAFSYILSFSGSFGKLNENIRLNVPMFRFINFKAKANNIEPKTNFCFLNGYICS